MPTTLLKLRTNEGLITYMCLGTKELSIISKNATFDIIFPFSNCVCNLYCTYIEKFKTSDYISSSKNESNQQLSMFISLGNSRYRQSETTWSSSGQISTRRSYNSTLISTWRQLHSRQLHPHQFQLAPRGGRSWAWCRAQLTLAQFIDNCNNLSKWPHIYPIIQAISSARPKICDK